MSPEEALAAALHETDGTQHYITHQVVNGEDVELVACNGVGHEDDADIVRAALAAEGYTIVRSDELAGLRWIEIAAEDLQPWMRGQHARWVRGSVFDRLRAALENRP